MATTAAAAPPGRKTAESGCPPVPEGVRYVPRRPLIAVTSSRRRALVTMVLNRLALWRAGARTVRLFPGRERSLEDVHGIVVGGGDDIDVRLYDDALTLDTRIDPDRDALEIRVLRHAEARGLPVLGVCRGAQMLNVYRGGTLHTDVRRAYAGFPRHRTVLAKRWVTATADSLLRRLYGRERFKVNSLHSQAIDRPGRHVRIVARDEYGVTQGIELVPDSGAADAPGFAAIGVQWHPEFLILNRRQQGLFRWLVGQAKKQVGRPGKPVD
ncbi:MAG: gamma-glutamyl-gamma-aminobutyrate hydrolase family protein [Rhodospirillaceae bacterium]|nr:gamma-glutamyl-gamma-aminobutyrate hydrolase family protein [Rhodospirillaceae bacterium]